jgi:outer membrane lipoprotein LolB
VPALAMRSMFRCCALLFAALLAACAGNPLAPVPFNTTGFDLAGRMAVRYQDRSFSSALRWKQGADGDEVWLNTPLGQTLAYLQDNRAGATLTTAEQKQYHAQTIESLTHSALGWRFPLAGLRYWVLGQTAPGVDSAEVARDGANRLTRFTQADWQVVLEYADAAASRPSRLELAGGDAQIRLVIDSPEMARP